jgi:hypothetical protein
MMGKIPMETERGKKRLADLKGSRKHECANCRNQTFLLIPCSDFPFFYALCSKCGSSFVR